MSRIGDLIAAMTLAEKLGQLTMTTAGYAVTGPVATTDLQARILSGQINNVLNLYGADRSSGVQRLALEQGRSQIPLLVVSDVVHGHRTIFPIPLGEASLFDPVAWRPQHRESGAGSGGRWSPSYLRAHAGRGARSPLGPDRREPGEDPLVGEVIARAKVKGFQGANLAAPDTLGACAKHYCAYGAVTAGREYAPTDVSQRSLHEIYLPPFEAAVAAGVATIMPAFTDLDGVPMTANSALLKDYLRGRLNFQRRVDRRLQRHRRIDPSRRGDRHRRSRRTGAESRGGHGPDGQRLSRRLAYGPQPWAGRHGRYRRQRAPRAYPERAIGPVRQSLWPGQSGECRRARGAAHARARCRRAFGGDAEERCRRAADPGRCELAGDRAAWRTIQATCRAAGRQRAVRKIA